MSAPRPDMPLVTIVTPSYNQGEFIQATIESVLSQDYANVEYIIMDGASTDNTAEVVRPYLNRLTFISEPDHGQSHAINKGFAMAKGAIVAWLNSDDIFLPGAISKAVAALLEHPDAAGVYGDGYQVDRDGSIKQKFPYTQHFDRWKLTFISDYILQQTLFFRKSALDKVGPLREDLHFVMDWEILIRLARKFDLICIREDMGSIREYEAAKTSAGGLKRAKEIRAMLASYCGMRYPPGYQVYGFVTYEQVIHQATKAWPKSFQVIGKPIRYACSKIISFLIGRAMAYGQAWHRDRWCGQEARVMLSEGAGAAIIRGLIPGNVPGLETQRVRVICEGRVLADENLGHGKFELRFTVPQPALARCPVLTIKCAQSFSFAQNGMSADQRRLAMRLDEVAWARPHIAVPAEPVSEKV